MTGMHRRLPSRKVHLPLLAVDQVKKKLKRKAKVDHDVVHRWT